MWDATWTEVHFSGLRYKLSVAYLDQRFAIDEIPEFILIMVNVHWHPAAGRFLFSSENGQCTASVFTGKNAVSTRSHQGGLCFGVRRA
jgi:hypothetical protein